MDDAHDPLEAALYAQGMTWEQVQFHLLTRDMAPAHDLVLRRTGRIGTLALFLLVAGLILGGYCLSLGLLGVLGCAYWAHSVTVAARAQADPHPTAPAHEAR